MNVGLLPEPGLAVFSPLASAGKPADGNGRGSPAAAPPGQWEKILAEFDRLRELDTDWDGQGADTPAAANLDHALTWFERMRGSGRALPPSKVVPGTAGEVYLVWHGEGSCLEAEINAPGQVEWLYFVEGKATKQWKTDAGTLWLVDSAF